MHPCLPRTQPVGELHLGQKGAGRVAASGTWQSCSSGLTRCRIHFRIVLDRFALGEAACQPSELST
jgi:hypothetical protein